MQIIKLVIVMCVLLTAPLAVAQLTSDYDAQVKQGRQQQRAAQYNDALQTFATGYRHARASNDKQWAGKFLFYQGNTYLMQAETAPGSEKRALAQRAIEIFKQVVYQQPESGASKLKLAHAYEFAGDDANADGWYLLALAQNDQKQVLYRLRYAEFLAPTRPKEAIKQLNLVLQAQPNNAAAHKQLMQIYSAPKYAGKLERYLLEQIKMGQVLRAQDTALEALANPDWPARFKPGLMSVVAKALARQYIAPRAYQRSEPARKLQQIATLEPQLSVCISELNATMRATRAIDYQWWVKTRDRKTAISNLMRARAKYYDQENRPELARNLYQDAARLASKSDPSAVKDLVNFYSKRGDLSGINQVAKNYEFALFEGKGQAYKKGDVEAIYDYHRTLASIYSFQAEKTGDWGSESKANSAAFQLKHAYATAKRSEKIVPDTRLVTNLAKSYEVTGKVGKANNVRLDAAEMYNSKGNANAAGEVLKTVNVKKLNNRTRARYNRVITNPAIINPGLKSGANPQTNRVDLNKARDTVIKSKQGLNGIKHTNTAAPVSSYNSSKTVNKPTLPAKSTTLKSATTNLKTGARATSLKKTSSSTVKTQSKTIKSSSQKLYQTQPIELKKSTSREGDDKRG